MKTRFIFICLLFLASINLFAQSGCRNVPMQEVKVIRAQKVKKDGKAIQKKENILIYKEIPSKPDQNFFKCNGLTFEKGGELLFRAKGSDNRMLTYNDYIQKSGAQKSNSSNLLSRGEPEGCYPPDTPYTHLLDDFASLKNDECLQAYFLFDTYWLNGDLRIKFTDKSILADSLIFMDSKGKSYEFEIRNGNITVKNEEFPEEEIFDIYLDLDGVKEKIAEGIRIINLPKMIARLKNMNYSHEEIVNILMQNYFSDAFVNDVRSERFSDVISNAVYEE